MTSYVLRKEIWYLKIYLINIGGIEDLMVLRPWEAIRRLAMPLFSCLLRADRILGLIESSCEVITAENSNLHLLPPTFREEHQSFVFSTLLHHHYHNWALTEGIKKKIFLVFFFTQLTVSLQRVFTCISKITPSCTWLVKNRNWNRKQNSFRHYGLEYTGTLEVWARNLWGDVIEEVGHKAALGQFFWTSLINEHNSQYCFEQIWKSHERAAVALAASLNNIANSWAIPALRIW